MSLGDLCLQFSLKEMKDGVKEDKPGSYTSERLREYFSICTRNLNGKEVSIGIKSGNWCAAAVSFSLHSVIEEYKLQNIKKPHEFRVEVVEVIRDMKKNKLFFSKESILNGSFKPRVGDVVFFDRSDKNRPETAWWRHIARISVVRDDGFECLNGNSYGAYRLSNHKFSDAKFIGVGSYSFFGQQNSETEQEIDLSHLDEKDLAPEFDSGFVDIYDELE